MSDWGPSIGGRWQALLGKTCQETEARSRRRYRRCSLHSAGQSAPVELPIVDRFGSGEWEWHRGAGGDGPACREKRVCKVIERRRRGLRR